MDAIPDPIQAPPARRRWRVTLREMLLGTVAFCAILAAVPRPNLFNRSPFLQSLDARELIRSIEQDLQARIEITGDQQSSVVRNTKVTVRDIDLRLRCEPPATRASVMVALKAHLETRLHQEGCRIEGAGYAGTPTVFGVSDFNLYYRRGSLSGDVYVHAIETDNDEWHLLMVLHEFER